MATYKHHYFKFAATTDRRQKLEIQWAKEREEAMEIFGEQRGKVVSADPRAVGPCGGEHPELPPTQSAMVLHAGALGGV